MVDHNVPTTDRSKPNPDPESAEQIAALAENAREFGVEYFNEYDKRQGIVHVIGPEQGFTFLGHDHCLAATVTPRRTAHSARSPMASARRRSSMCSPPKR